MPRGKIKKSPTSLIQAFLWWRFSKIVPLELYAFVRKILAMTHPAATLEKEPQVQQSSAGGVGGGLKISRTNGEQKNLHKYSPVAGCSIASEFARFEKLRNKQRRQREASRVVIYPGRFI